MAEEVPDHEERLFALVRPQFADQRESFCMFNRFHRKVHIQIGPVQMVWVGELYVQQLSDGNIPEPGELLKRQKQFSSPEEQPKTVLRDVRDFNFRNGLSKLRGFHATILR